MTDERTPIRLIIDNAQDAPAADIDADDDGRRRGGGPPNHLLPEGCPVEPLGKRQGIYYFLNDKRELIALKKLERLAIEELWGRYADELDETFPRKNQDGDIVGW